MNKASEAFDKVLDIISCQKHDTSLQHYVDTVNTALIEGDRLKEAAKVIREKEVKLDYIRKTTNYEHYNCAIRIEFNHKEADCAPRYLTESEYKLVKECFA